MTSEEEEAKKNITGFLSDQQHQAIAQTLLSLSLVYKIETEFRPCQNERILKMGERPCCLTRKPFTICTPDKERLRSILVHDLRRTNDKGLNQSQECASNKAPWLTIWPQLCKETETF